MRALEKRLANAPVSVLAIMCGLWIAVTDGIAETPNIKGWTRIAKAFPHSAHLSRRANFIQSSPLGPGLAHAVGADRSPSTYAALHLVLVVVCVAIAAFAVIRRFGAMAGRLTVAALFASPLSNVLLTWLGQPDPITLATGAIVAAASSPPLLFVASAIIAFNHREQALVMLGGALVVRWAVGDVRVRHAAAVVGGVVVGVVGLAMFKSHFGIEGSRIAAADHLGPSDFLHNFSTTWQVTLFASFGATWVVVLGLGWHLRRRQRLIFTAVLVSMVIVTIFTLDTTRVFAIVSMPVVIVLIGYCSTRVQRPTLNRILLVTVVAGLTYPHLVVWGDRIYVSSIAHSISWLAPI